MKHQLHTQYLDMSCGYSPAPKELISVCEESGQVLDVLMESESRGDKGQCRASAWPQLDQLSPSASHLGHLSLVCSHPSPSCGGAGILESRLPWKGAGPERKAGLTALRSRRSEEATVKRSFLNEENCYPVLSSPFLP